MASGLGSGNMAMVSRFPKTLVGAADNVLLQNSGDKQTSSRKMQPHALYSVQVPNTQQFLEIFESIWLIHEPFSTQKEAASCA